MEKLFAQRNQARMLWIQGEYTQAYAWYDQMLQTHPYHPYVLCDYGLALYAEANDMEKATHLLEQALIVKPHFLVALLGLGELYAIGYLSQNSSQNAADLFYKVIHLAPQNKKATVTAYIQLGSYLPTWQEKVHAFRQALQIEPSSVAAHRNLAAEFLLRYNYEEAWNELKVVEQLLSVGHQPTLSVQKDLEKIEKRQPLTLGFIVETVLDPWFKGETDAWDESE